MTAQETKHDPTEAIEEQQAIVSPDYEPTPAGKADLAPIEETPSSAANQPAVAAVAATADESADTLGVPASLAPDVVGAGGAFTQRIDINIPEFRDLPLRLALTYNSSDIARTGAAKLVAFGWSLQGFSIIERKSLGGGVPTYDDGQDLYVLDGEELMACAGAGATNPWVLKYPLRYLTDNPSTSCSAGGNLTQRMEDFRRIIFDTVTNTFTVTRPDGVRLIYTSVGVLVGDTSVAGTPERDYATKARWLLTRIEDTQATPNVVTYTYAFTAKADGYAPRPTRIDYAGYTVLFDYRLFPTNAIARFATGSSLMGRQPYQLRSIRILEGEANIRGYQLTHTQSAATLSQLLVRITEYGSDLTFTSPDITGGSALPPTQFDYSADQFGYELRTYAETEFHSTYMVVDTNLDGTDELAFSERMLSKTGTIKVGSDHEISYSVPFHMFLAGHYQFDRSRVLQTLPLLSQHCTVDSLNSPGSDSARSEKLFVLGNDRTSGDLFCLARKYQAYTVGSQGNDRTKVSFSTGNLTATIDTPIDTEGPFDYFGQVFNAIWLGNIDLDPGSEVVNNKSEILYDIDGGEIGSGESNGYITIGGRFVSDFSGDGVDDSILTNSFRRRLPEAGYRAGVLVPRGASLGYGVSSSSQPDLVYKPNQLTGWIEGDFIGYADMNGDGLADIVFHDNNRAQADAISYFPSTGRTLGPKQTISLGVNVIESSPNYVIASSGIVLAPARAYAQHPEVRDINSDGLADVILHDGYYTSNQYGGAPYRSSRSWVFLNTGQSFVQVPILASTAALNGFLRAGDFDGDGLTDLALSGTANIVNGNVCKSVGYGKTICVPTYAKQPGRVLFADGDIPNRLISVRSQAGATTTVTYAPSSDFGTNQMPGIQQVVKTIITDDGRGEVSTVEYRYVGGRYDFVARRTLGYKTVTAILSPVAGETEGPQVITTYLNDHLAEYSLVKSRVVIQGGVTLRHEIFDYTILKTGNGPWRADGTSERKAALSGSELVETTLTREVNAFGQITRETALGFTTNGVDLDASDNVTVTTGYSPNLTAYIVDRPIFRREEAGAAPTVTMADDLSYASMSYDGAAANTVAPINGNLTKVEEWIGSATTLTLRTAKLLTYDSWGNVLTETDAKAVEAGGGPTVTYTYDTTKRLFWLTRTNALGHIETVAWNTLCQVPSTITDPDARVTTKTYDSFCREIRTDLPGGQYLITRYVSFGSPTLQHVERETKSGSATPGRDLAITREYFDGLGRTWAKTQPGTTNAIADATLQLSAYDARGNLAWTSLPLPFASLDITPNAAQRTSFTYDGLNRAVDTLLPDGAKRSLTYLTISLSHYGGPTLAYPATRAQDEHCFDATGANTICGEATQITDAVGRLIRLDRNDTALSDMDADGAILRSTSYRYDAKGSLIAVTDPGGIVFAYTYDIYGNRLTADDPGLGFWTLTYDANNNLLAQTDAKGQLISFAYDALNRVTLKAVGIGAARVETRFTYDEARAGFYNNGKETTQEVWTPTATTHRVERDWHLMGGLAVERHLIDGRTYALETSFAPNGASLDQKLPGTPGATSTGWIGPFTYDAAGRVTAFTGYITSVTYNAWGQPTAAAYANGVTEAYVYDPARGWLTSVTGTLPGGDMAFRAAYDRSATGRIFRADTQALVGGSPTDLGGSYDYAYDYTGRLLSATNWRGVTAFDQVFAYDRAGRIRLKGPTLATATSYAYTDPLKPDHAPSAITTGGITTPFTYDANGNMLTGLGGKIMTYDGENRPLSVTYLGKRTCYVYGVDGKRLKKVENLAPTQDCTTIPASAPATVYFGAVEVRNWLIAGQEQILTYPHPTVKLLNGTTPAAATYLHRDGLASVRAITDAVGVKIEASLYKPFGEQSEWVLPSNAAPETKGWIGERYDADAGLQYLNARYYDPELSLFLQPDWFEVTKPGVGTNRFSYSFNDPVNKFDPGGNEIGGRTPEEKQEEEDQTALNDYLKDESVPLDKRVETALEITKQKLEEQRQAAIADPSADGSLLYSDAVAKLQVIETLLGGSDTSTIGERAIAASKATSLTIPEPVITSRALPPGVGVGPFAPPTGGVPASKVNGAPTAAEARAVTSLGTTYGCHNCGTKTPGTASGKFVNDHQPPTSVNPTGVPQELYPHCLSCSAIQGGILRWFSQ